MSVERVEFLVEEPSMEAFLRALLPEILGEIEFQVYPFQCKDELLQRLPERLKGYSSWLPESWRIVVVVDRDDSDCYKLKQDLEKIAKNERFVTRTSAKKRPYAVVNRIAIEELEAWYFGDWKAVRDAYPRTSSAIPTRAAYRNPDEIRGGTWEAFEREMKKAGYFKGGLRKIEAARNIARYMDPMCNTSRSFQVLREALSEMTGI